MNKSSGLIKNLTKEQLEELIEASSSFSDIVERLGLRRTSRQVTNVKDRIRELQLNYKEINTNFYLKRNNNLHNKTKTPLNNLLKKGTKFNPRNRKKEILDKGLLKNKCYGNNCGITTEWNEQPIILQFDHINGDHTDNRITNLRLLCPNCHSQTKTYSGKNKKKNRTCIECNQKKIIASDLGFCNECLKDYIKSLIIKHFSDVTLFESLLKTTYLKDISINYNLKLSLIKFLVKNSKKLNIINKENNYIKIINEVRRSKAGKSFTKVKHCKNCKLKYNSQKNNKFCSKQCHNEFRKDIAYYPYVNSIIFLYNKHYSQIKIQKILKISKKRIKSILDRYKREKNKLNFSLSALSDELIVYFFKQNNNLTRTASFFGCSDNAIKKRLKKINNELLKVYSFNFHIPEKKCKYCNKNFKPKDRANLFCNNNCYLKQQNKNYEKNISKIIQLKSKNYSFQEISKKLDIPKRTINDYYLKFLKNSRSKKCSN